ncbi:MAG: hypothetical protein JWM95_3621 [Gemmatimonadetes bacterium]|nr:hypothetical protein [Gemmatimonadota bacterium]
MKLFDVDWMTILNNLHRFTALPLDTRRALLEHLKPHGYAPVSLFGSHATAIAASGIAQFDPDRARLQLDDDHRALIKVLRAMHRHQVFEQPTVAALAKYLQEHFTADDIRRLGSHGPGSRQSQTAHSLAPRVAFDGWAGDLLATTTDRSLVAWATLHGLPATGLAVFGLAGMRSLARQLLSFPSGMPLSDLPGLFQSGSIDDASRALHAGLGALVFFAGLRAGDLEPVVGLWPTAAKELVRPAAHAPSVVVPVEQFTLAMEMEDMTIVMATIMAAPVRIRADDGAVFARNRVEIEGRLIPPPPWAAHLFLHPRLSRVDVAAMTLATRKFVELHDRGGAPHLRATKAGIKWLGLSPRDRLAAVVDPMRASKQKNPAGAYNHPEGAGFFPYTFPYVQAPKSLDLREDLTRALLLASAGFISLEQFLDHQSRDANPLLALPESSPGTGMYYERGDPRENHRNLWRNAVAHFITSRLFALGGASLGRLANGTFCFALTDVGRYLLGRAETFNYGTEDTGEVVIQPNFDVVFLGAAPRTEAALTRFAERVGVAPGLTLRITRASVLAAAESGATAADVVEALRSASSRPLPKNVEREIIGWIATVRRGQVRTVEIIECPNAETGDRVAVILGGKVRRIAPTVFELPVATPAARTALLKKLRGGGVFLEDTTARAPRAKPGRRRFEPFIDD